MARKPYTEAQKELARIRARKHYWANAEKAKVKSKAWRKANPEKCRGYYEKYRAQNPEKAAAMWEVWNAKVRGKLVEPKCCADCGEAAKLDAHHEDYSKPLDVVWICRTCHAARHLKVREVADG
jgi:hypothetical protein